MNIRFTLGSSPFSSTNSFQEARLKKVQALFFEHFGDRKPRPGDPTGTYGFPAFEFDAPVDDPDTAKAISEFGKLVKKLKPSSVAVVRQTLTTEEGRRARFLEPYHLGNEYVADAPDNSPLNPSMFLCAQCNAPNLDHVPDPLLVNRSVLKSHDFFHTGQALVVVRPHVLDLLKKAVGDQIRYGRAELAKAKGKSENPGPLFWVRPTKSIGTRIRVYPAKNSRSCEACKRTYYFGGLDDSVNEAGPGLFDDCLRAENFGPAKLNIALLPERRQFGRLWPEVVMSAALLLHLKENGVKGIVPFTNQWPPQAVFSGKGEPTLEPEVRLIGGTKPKSHKAAKPAKSSEANRKLVASLRNIPWDCDKDGFVYFHLSSPSFVVLEPMTGEEDSGGPYTVKNFKKPGLYRMPVSAIKWAEDEERGVAVDSGSLLFVDNEFLPALIEEYDWDKAHTKSGAFNPAYHQEVAEKIGSRFGLCSVPPKRFKSEFQGDGFYRIDATQIRAA